MTASYSIVPESSDPAAESRRRADYLENSLYADICRKELWAVLDDWLEFPVPVDREAIDQQLREMRHRRLITVAELDAAYRTELIARAYDDKAQSGPLFVGLARFTGSRKALETAARGAAVIAKATGVPTVAFLAVHRAWPPEADEAARQLGVTLVRYRSEEYIKYMGDDEEDD